MNESPTRSDGADRFIASLQRLVDKEERGALAALRRGLGKEPGEAAEMFPYVAPFLEREESRWADEPYFVVGSLFAWHPMHWTSSEEGGRRRDFGASFAWLRQKDEAAAAGVERRFVALLNCHREDLKDHLRHAVGLLRSKEIPVDYARLLRDIRGWDHEDRYVQRRWAQSFWRDAPGRGAGAVASNAAAASQDHETLLSNDTEER